MALLYFVFLYFDTSPPNPSPHPCPAHPSLTVGQPISPRRGGRGHPSHEPKPPPQTLSVSLAVCGLGGGGVKENVKRFLTSGFFHESVSPKHLSIPLGQFQIFPKIRGDIRSSRCTTGVVDTNSKCKKSSIIKVLII
jgi:hypothetical protein